MPALQAVSRRRRLIARTARGSPSITFAERLRWALSYQPSIGFDTIDVNLYSPAACESMSPCQTHTLKTVDGLRISFDHYAPGRRAEALIICPGFFKSKETPTFQRLSRALAQERDVITMDFCGHARSGGV